MSNKIETALRVIAIVSLIVGAWALAINQFSQFVENGKEAQLAQASADCVQFQAPHAVIVGGEVFCYATFNGSEQLAPLSYLQKAYGEPSSKQGEQ
jgi:hypothetical protein